MSDDYFDLYQAAKRRVFDLEAQNLQLRDAVQTYKRRHESGGPLSDVRPDSCRCSACDKARAALEAQVKTAQDLAADNFDVIQELRIQKVILEKQNRHQQGLLSGRDHTLIQTLEKEASQLREQNQTLREALERLARLGAEPHYGNSIGNDIARAALAATEKERSNEDRR